MRFFKEILEPQHLKGFITLPDMFKLSNSMDLIDRIVVTRMFVTKHPICSYCSF